MKSLASKVLSKVGGKNRINEDLSSDTKESKRTDSLEYGVGKIESFARSFQNLVDEYKGMTHPSEKDIKEFQKRVKVFYGLIKKEFPYVIRFLDLDSVYYADEN